MSIKKIAFIISEKNKPNSIGCTNLFINVFNSILKNHSGSYIISQHLWMFKLFCDGFYKKYDVVLGYDLHFRGSLIVLIAKLFHKKSMIVVCGKYWIEQSGIHKEYFGSIKVFAYRIMEKITLRYCSVLIAPDIEVFNYLNNKTNGNLIFMPQFGMVDINQFKYSDEIRSDYRVKLGIGQNDFVLIFVGHLTKSDGIDRVLKIFYDLNKQYTNIWLVVIGDGDQLSTIQQFKTSKRLDKLLLLGYISHNTIQNYMMVGDLGLLLLNEPQCGFGSIPLEFLSLNVPIISSKVGMLEEVIINGKTGFIINNDSDAIQRIQEIISSGVEFNKMKASTRRFIEENYSLSSFENRFELLINSTII